VVSSNQEAASLQGWTWLLRVGGIAAIIEGLVYIITTPAGPMMGAGPANSMTYLNALATHPQLANLTYGLIGFADLLMVPIALALYFALRQVSKSWMLLVTGMMLAYVAIDISTFVTTSTSLVSLTQSYASATNATQRTAILGAEYYGLSTIPLSQFLGWVFPNFAYLILVVALRVGHISKAAHIVGIFTVILGFTGGFGFLIPIPYLLNTQLAGLAVFGLFWLLIARILLRASSVKPIPA
jgi:hypothetical protein